MFSQTCLRVAVFFVSFLGGSCISMGQQKSPRLTSFSIKSRVSENWSRPVRAMKGFCFHYANSSSTIVPKRGLVPTSLEQADVSIGKNGLVFFRHNSITRPLDQPRFLNLSAHESTVIMHGKEPRELQLLHHVSSIKQLENNKKFDSSLFELEQVANLFAKPLGNELYLMENVGSDGSQLIGWEGFNSVFRLNGSELSGIAMACDWKQIEFQKKTCFQGVRKKSDDSIETYICCPELNYVILSYTNETTELKRGFEVSAIDKSFDDIQLKLWVDAGAFGMKGISRFNAFSNAVEGKQDLRRQDFLDAIPNETKVKIVEKEHLEYCWRNEKVVPVFDKNAVELLDSARMKK